MGGSSKSQIVGYKYFFGVHMGLGRGPVDAIHEVRVADKRAWIGEVTGNATINIDAPELFGGDEREGGIRGPLEVMMGGPTQEASTGLKAMLGSVLPGFRGMVTLFFNGLIATNNPYPKPWKFRLNRVLKGWDGAPWYPEKAQIRLVASGASGASLSPWSPGSVDPRTDGYNYLYQAESSTVWRNTLEAAIDDLHSTLQPTANVIIGWSLGKARLFPASVIPSPAPGDTLTLHLNRQPPDAGYYQTMAPNPPGTPFYCGAFEAESVGPSPKFFWWPRLYDGADIDYVTGIDGLYRLTPGTSAIDSYEQTLNYCSNYAPIGGSLPAVTFTPDAHIKVKVDEANQGGVFAMNPAHIIYECLTNRVWGRGLLASKIDTASFEQAANTLFDENFGLCIKWTRKDSIESFIQGIVDHIGATLYVSRTTKLYTIKLIRGGYNLDELPLFDTESGILSISDASVASIGSTVNAAQVKYHDWENDEDRTVSVKNSAAIVAAGGVVNQVTRDFPGIPTSSLALRVAQRELRAVSTSLRKFTINMDRRGEDFAPGDVIAIRDPKRGIPKMAVRVGRVEDGTLLDGKITLTVIQDVFSLPETAMSADVPSTWVPPNTKPCIDQQRVIEAPYFLLARTMTKADFDYISEDSGYIATFNSRGQPLNQGYKIAVRPDAPTSDDNPTDDSYVCGI